MIGAMKKITVFTVLSFVLLPAVRAQKSHAELVAEAAQLEVDHQELVNLERETVRALQLNNATFFRRVFSDDFVGTAADGQVISKSDLINAVQTSQVKYSSLVATDIQVRIYQETAVVTCLWTSRGVSRGQAFSRQSRVVHVFVNGPRGWQAVVGQETLLPGQGK